MCARPGQPRTLALAAGALLAAVVFWLLFVGTGSTQAANKPLHIPRNFLGLLSGPTPFDSTDASRIASTRIRAARISLDWYRVQPRREVFNWYIDPMVARLAANGIAVLPTLSGAPKWIADKTTTPPVGNSGAKAAWQTFVTAAVRRYGRGGTFWTAGPGGQSPFHAQCGCDASPVPITAWQIWNEPNLRHYFTPRPSPKRYATLVKLSRPAIKRADGEAKLILAGLSAGSGKRGDLKAVPYLMRLYRYRGIKQSFDATAIHPYAHTIGDMRSTLSKFRKVMKKKGDGRTPLWITEFGWGSKHPDRFGINKGLRGQKRMLKNSVEMVLRKRKAWRVQHMYWFFWRDPPKSDRRYACRFCSSAGLVRNDRRPKPAYLVLRRLAKRAR